MQINEGGNVFKDAQGKPLTQRIKKADVPPTVKWLEQLTGLDLTGKEVDDEGVPVLWLGSTARRPDSGDIDLVVTSVSKDQLFQQLSAWIAKQGLDPKEWIKKGAELHLRTPIKGDPKQGFAQTDFNFFSSPELARWAQFYMSGTSAGYKGMARNVLLSSLAKSQGLKIGGNGMISRATGQLVQGGLDPDYVAQVLLGPGHTQHDLRTVERIYTALSNDPNRDVKLADFQGYLEREGLSEPNSNVQESEVSFIARLRDRIVNQGMYALIEAEQPKVKKDPRIPHPEDAIFLQGTAGAARQISALTAAVNNAKNITIKWDGKPALIFGYLPDGTFTIVDKYMWDANFPARSPKDWIRYDQQKASGKSRPDLYPKIQAIWPGLKAAVKAPGFYWGDLLWAGELQPVNGQYVVQPNTVKYTIDANSELGRTIPNTTGGVVVHQKFDQFGAPKAQVWNGQGLETVPGGVDIVRPNLGLAFSLKPQPKLESNAKSALATYGPAVDDMLSKIPAAARAQMQTYFNQRITGGTNLSLPNWLKTKASGATQKTLLGYTTKDSNGNDQYVPGLLVTVDKNNNIKPTAAYQGLEKIWSTIYNYKLNLAQQLESQIKGIQQSTADAPEGEGFIVPTDQGLVKLVNRGVFSLSNVQKNNPT